jgi:hypothetical protein
MLLCKIAILHPSDGGKTQMHSCLCAYEVGLGWVGLEAGAPLTSLDKYHEKGT